ncbi:MAG: 30S ribosomal protein S16 [Acidiferrobacterales bacterium]
MVTIRLARRGANKRPFYSIIVADRRRAPNGDNIEQIGFYNPLATPNEERLRVNMERYQYWLSKGAKASDRVASLVEQSKASS